MRLKNCVTARRHTKDFNFLMGMVDHDQYSKVHTTDDEAFRNFHSQLCGLSLSIATRATDDTRHLPRGAQRWELVERVRDILATGELNIASTKGFKQESAFIFLGCSQCSAGVRILCPYMSAGGAENALYPSAQVSLTGTLRTSSILRVIGIAG